MAITEVANVAKHCKRDRTHNFWILRLERLLNCFKGYINLGIV